MLKAWTKFICHQKIIYMLLQKISKIWVWTHTAKKWENKIKKNNNQSYIQLQKTNGLALIQIGRIQIAINVCQVKH